ncbi:hypothetical protein NADE_005626 [Nannochloris sp. 'desiccata']|nr:hypothetical protein NADE_005626 [Chlorella desiccata (nom. nud.)]
MESRFEGLRHRLEELQVHLLATSKTSSLPLSSSSRQREKNRTEPQRPKEAPSSEHRTNNVRDSLPKNSNLEVCEAPITPKKRRHQPTTAMAPAQQNPPRFQSTISPSKSNLKFHPNGDAATVSGLLSRLREEEQKRTSERAALQMQVQKEKQRAHHAEAAARRAEDQRDFRLGEVRHLKAALKRRDDVITSLQDQVRDMEVGISYADAVQLAQGERDEAKAVLNESQKQLEEISAELDAALAQAEQARELLRRGEREKEMYSERWDRANSEITRIRDDLHEERSARAILEQAVSVLSAQAANRQARLRQLLAMGELLSFGDSDEKSNSSSTEATSVLDCESPYEYV